MRFFLSRAIRTRKVSPRTPFERSPRAVEFVVLGIGIFIAMTIFVLRYEKSVLRAEEATRKQDCFVLSQAIEQYTGDKHTAPESFDDLIQFKYISAVPVDPVTHEKLSLPDCMGGPEGHMDPVETIPGFSRLYSHSRGTSAERTHSAE